MEDHVSDEKSDQGWLMLQGMRNVVKDGWYCKGWGMW